MAKKIISYIFVFLLIISLTGGVGAITLSQTALNKKFTIGILEKNAYYSKTYNEIVETFKNNTIQSGLPDDVLDNITSQDKVKKDVNLLIDYLYGDTDKLEIDVENLETTLQANIDAEIEKNSKKISDEEKEAIKEYIKTISKIYKTGILYEESYLSQIRSVIVKIGDLLSKAGVGACFASIIILVILIFINKSKVYRYVSTTFLASGILLILVKAFETFFTKIDTILLLNEAFSTFLINLVDTAITYLTIIGIILAILGLIANVISAKKRYEF